MLSTGDLTGQLDLGQLDLGREFVKAVRRFEPVCRTSSRKKGEWAEIRTPFFRDSASPAAWFQQEFGVSLPWFMSRVSNLNVSDGQIPHTPKSPNKKSKLPQELPKP